MILFYVYVLFEYFMFAFFYVIIVYEFAMLVRIGCCKVLAQGTQISCIQQKN